MGRMKSNIAAKQVTEHSVDKIKASTRKCYKYIPGLELKSLSATHDSSR